MGDHDAPVGWLERWQQTEPIRMYLWTVSGAVLAASVTFGVLTGEQAVAVTGVVSAVLTVGGSWAARRVAYAPATVEVLLDRQHALSFVQGVEEERRAAELDEMGPAPADRVPATRELRAQPPGPDTAPRERAPRCTHVEEHRRCVLPRHPETFPHRLEEGVPAE